MSSSYAATFQVTAGTGQHVAVLGSDPDADPDTIGTEANPALQVATLDQDGSPVGAGNPLKIALPAAAVVNVPFVADVLLAWPVVSVEWDEVQAGVPDGSTVVVGQQGATVSLAVAGAPTGGSTTVTPATVAGALTPFTISHGDDAAAVQATLLSELSLTTSDIVVGLTGSTYKFTPVPGGAFQSTPLAAWTVVDAWTGGTAPATTPSLALGPAFGLYTVTAGVAALTTSLFDGSHAEAFLRVGDVVTNLTGGDDASPMHFFVADEPGTDLRLTPFAPVPNPDQIPYDGAASGSSVLAGATTAEEAIDTLGAAVDMANTAIEGFTAVVTITPTNPTGATWVYDLVGNAARKFCLAPPSTSGPITVVIASPEPSATPQAFEMLLPTYADGLTALEVANDAGTGLATVNWGAGGPPTDLATPQVVQIIGDGTADTYTANLISDPDLSPYALTTALLPTTATTTGANGWSDIPLRISATGEVSLLGKYAITGGETMTSGTSIGTTPVVPTDDTVVALALDAASWEPGYLVVRTSGEIDILSLDPATTAFYATNPWPST